VLEDGTLDAYQFIWNVWWAGESLVHLRSSPFFTTYLFYPEGIPLLFHTLSLSLGLLSIPAQGALPGGVVTAYNLLVLAAPALMIVAVALLAHEVTGDPWAAIAAGFMATVNPVAVWFLPVLYLNCSYLIAFILWAWWRMHRRRHAADVALVFVLVIGLIFASQEYAMMALALLALDSAARVIVPKALGMARMWGWGTIVFWGITGTVLGILALVASSAPGEPPPVSQLRQASGYFAGFVTPPWLVAPPSRFWTVLYLGTAPLLLIGAACLWGRRSPGYWVLATIAMVLMAMGPYLHIGAGDRGTAQWWHTLPPPGPPGPYLAALEILPILHFFRAPYRWVVPAQITLAVVAALGIAGLRGQLSREPVRRIVTGVLLIAIPALVALDTRGLRAPIAPAVVPGAYDVLRRDPEPCAVLELPSGLTFEGFGNFASLYMFYQTAHRKFLLDGTVSRMPQGRRFLVQRPVADFADLPYVKYVVVHRDLLDHAFPVSIQHLEQVESLLTHQGTLILREGAIEVYELHTFDPKAVRVHP
jgi:hypothetical protein